MNISILHFIDNLLIFLGEKIIQKSLISKKFEKRSHLVYQPIAHIINDFSFEPFIKSHCTIQPILLKPIYYDISKQFIQFPTLDSILLDKQYNGNASEKEIQLENSQNIVNSKIVSQTQEIKETESKNNQTTTTSNRGITGFVKNFFWGS